MSAACGGRVLVLNAGSSSIKCGLYEAAASGSARLARVHADLRDDALALTVEAAGDERVDVIPKTNANLGRVHAFY